MNNKNCILVIDSDQNTNDIVKETFLNSTLYTIFFANNGIQGLEDCRNLMPSLIILNYTLPRLDGMDVYKLLKENKKTSYIPILLLLNSKELFLETQKIVGNDFISKPIFPQQLKEKVNLLIELKKEVLPSTFDFEQIGPIQFSKLENKIKIQNEKIIKLNNIEFKILHYLTSYRNKLITRESILEKIWNPKKSPIQLRTIDVHIQSLRKKNPELKQFIKSIYKKGYSFIY